MDEVSMSTFFCTFAHKFRNDEKDFHLIHIIALSDGSHSPGSEAQASCSHHQLVSRALGYRVRDLLRPHFLHPLKFFREIDWHCYDIVLAACQVGNCFGL